MTNSARKDRKIVCDGPSVDEFGYWYHDVRYEVENAYIANGRTANDGLRFMATHPTLLMHCYISGYTIANTAYEMTRHILPQDSLRPD